MLNEVHRLNEQVIDIQVKAEETRALDAARYEEMIAQLRDEKSQLAEQLRDVRKALKQQSEGWQNEHNKRVALMFSDLPLNLLGSPQEDMNFKDATLSKQFPMVTIAQCDIVGFDSLTRHMAPQDVIKVVDQFHAIIDEAFGDKELFIMERTYHSCTVASGLIERYETPPKSHSVTSMSESSSGSEAELQLDRNHNQSKDQPAATKSPCHYASLLATSVLKLMSYSMKGPVQLE